MKTIVGLMKRTLRYLQSNMTMFLKTAFPNNIFTKKLDLIFSHTDMESSTTQCRTGNFNDIQWFWQSWRSLADCGWTFFTMALAVHGGSHRVYGKPWRPKARKIGGEVQVSNQPETSNTTSRVLCHFPETPQRYGWVFWGEGVSYLGYFHAESAEMCPSSLVTRALDSVLALAFALTLIFTEWSRGIIYQGIIFWGERGGWLGIRLIISWAILGVEILISYFHVLPLPPQLATATQPAPKRFHRFSIDFPGASKRTHLYPSQISLKDPSSKTILGGVEQLV